MIPSKTDPELRQIALDFVEGRIFSDRHCQSSDLPMVFMAIALGAFSEWTEEQFQQLGMIYEYISEAGPRSINGMPSFLSMKLLNKEDAERVIGYAKQLFATRQQFLEKTP